MIEATAIIETYAFARPLLYVFGAAVVLVIGCAIALQRAGRNK